jgi:hypothetical protein
MLRKKSLLATIVGNEVKVNWYIQAQEVWSIR